MSNVSYMQQETPPLVDVQYVQYVLYVLYEILFASNFDTDTYTDSKHKRTTTTNELV